MHCALMAWAVGALLAAAPQGAEPSEQDEREVHLYIQAAVTLYRSLDDGRALEQLAQAKALPHRLSDSVEISLYEGLILSDEGLREDSEAAFRAAFALDPEAKLPISVSPKLEALIEQVRAKAYRQSARATAPDGALPGAAGLHQQPSGGLSPWIPAAGGAALLVGAGACAAVEQSIEARLRSGDPAIASPSQLDAVVNQGKTATTLGVVLAAAGAAALGVAGFTFYARHRTEAEHVSLVVMPGAALITASFALP